MSDRKGLSPRFSDAEFSELSIKKAVNYEALHKWNNVLLSFSVGLCWLENWSPTVLLIGSMNHRHAFVKSSEFLAPRYIEFNVLI